MSTAKALTSLLLLFALNGAFCQNLLSEDSIKSWILDIKQVTENYPDSAKKLITKLRKDNPELSLEIKADLLKTEGATYIYTGLLDTAIVKFEESGKVYGQIIEEYRNNGDTLISDYFEAIKSQSNIINNHGAVAYYQSNYELAVKQFIKASEIQEGLLSCPIEPIRKKSFEDFAMSVDNIGAIYNSLGQKEKSLDYRMRAHKMIGNRGDRTAMRIKMNIAIIYYKNNELDSMAKYANQIYTLADSVSMANEYYAATSLIGQYYLSINHLDSASYYLNIATPKIEKLGSNVWVEDHYLRLGEYYLKRGDFNKALQNINKAYDILLSKDTRDNLIKTYRLFHEVYFEVAKKYNRPSDYRLAIDYLHKNTRLNDSIIKAQRFKEFNELQSKYETEKKEAENTFLRNETSLKAKTISNQQKWILAIAVLFIVVLGLLIFQIRSRKLLARQKKLIQNQKNKLTELDSFKSRFFANLSHDLRTPIALIMGNLRIIGTEEGGYLTVQGELSRKKALQNAQKLISLSDEIRDLTSLEASKTRLEFQKVNISEYLKLLVSMFKSAADIKGVKLSYQTNLDKEAIVHLDPKQFEKIIYNLLSNALKFTSKGDEIKLSLMEANNTSFKIQISDTGSGVKPNQLPHIFERYYQSPENEHRTVEGLGIGLSIVKELITLHGGDISAESELGKGSSFYITLPKNLDKEAETFTISVTNYLEKKSDTFKESLVDTIPLMSPENSEKKEHTILVVDDHIEIREYIATFLIDSYNVFYAGNGLEALELLDKTKIDLVITDLMMPVMDGFEFIDEFKEKHHQLPIMVVSARTLSDDRQKILSKGVNEIISKPFDENEFIARIKNILSNKEYYEPMISTNKDIKKEIHSEILIKINDLLKARLQDSKITVQDLGDIIFASERKTFRLIKELTGLTPLEYITDFRMRMAEDLLNKKEFTSLTEIAQAVGIKNSTRFVKVFEEKFGYNPSEKLNK